MFKFFKNSVQYNLNEHAFFLNINYWINIGIDNIVISNHIKKRVVSKFLTIKLSTYEKNLNDFINNISHIKHCEILLIQNLLIKITKECEEEAVKKGVPILFIEKFKKIHENNFLIVFDAIESICSSKFYSTINEKFAAVLDVLLFYFRVTFTDVERTINELNGELECVLKNSIFDI